MRKLILLIAFISSVSFAKAQFYPAATGVSNIIHSIYCINADTVIAVGEQNSIYKTTNGGSSWDLRYIQNSSSADNFYDVVFIDNDTGFVCGKDSTKHGVILKTCDGGQNWLKIVEIPETTTYGITKLSFPSHNIGYASYERNITKILKTIDAGKMWDSLASVFKGNYNTLQFINDTTGFVSVDSFYKTKDGGNTWLNLSPLNPPDVTFRFLNLDTGFISDNSGFLSTYTGFNNLINTTLYCTTQSIFFTNEKIGYIALFDSYHACSKIMKTIDCGINWTTLVTFTGIEGYYCVCFANDSVGYIAGTSIKKTTNGGLIVGIEKNQLSVNAINVFPNPVTDNLQIQTGTNSEGRSEMSELKIYDVVGNLVLERSIANNKVNIGVSVLPNGIYIVKATTKKGVVVKKFVKE